MRKRIATTLTIALLAAGAAGAHPQDGPPGRPFRAFERFVPHQSRLGIQLQDMTPELREFMRAPKERGVLVVRVNPGSSAEKAGLRVGDVIVAVGGENVETTPELVHAVLAAEKDAKLALEVVRDGKARKLEATLEGEPAFAADPMRWAEERGPAFRDAIEQRMREIEARLRQLEERLRSDEVKRGELDT